MISAGVCKTVRSGLIKISPRTVMVIVIRNIKTILFAIVSLILFSSLAPNALAVRIENPMQNPLIMLNSRETMAVVEPTAASSEIPSVRPTMIVSPRL